MDSQGRTINVGVPHVGCLSADDSIFLLNMMGPRDVVLSLPYCHDGYLYILKLNSDIPYAGNDEPRCPSFVWRLGTVSTNVTSLTDILRRCGSVKVVYRLYL